MPNYQNGKVYKITSGEMTYIGSTTAPTLARRLANHISESKKTGRKSTTSFPLIDTGDYQITLIELYPCGSKDELTARERYWIENTVCVNKTIPGRTYQEYHQDYKELRNEYSRQYHEANRDKINARRKANHTKKRESSDNRKPTPIL